jgi:hypothetical protein
MQTLALRRTLVHEKSGKVMEHFEQIGTRGYYRPVAQVTFEQAVDLVAAAMSHARSLGLVDLLVNTTGLTGFAPPSVFARYAMSTRWAQTGGSALRVGMVTRPELIDPQKIGVLMMQNRGGLGDVFVSEAEALEWLDSGLAPGRGAASPGKRPAGP